MAERPADRRAPDAPPGSPPGGSGGTIDHVEVLAAEGAGLMSVMRDGQWNTPIPAAPGWDLIMLADHIAKAWRWAAHIVNDRLTEPAPLPSEPTMAPDMAMGQLQAALVEVLDALRSCPDDVPVWGFGLHPRTARFWKRRQAIETLIHRIDAEQATDELSPIDPAVAADGVGEFLDVLLPRLYRTRTPPVGAIEAIATDTGDRWIHGDPAGGIGTLTGRAEDLLLALWRRRPESAVGHGGDAAVLAGWWALGAM